MKYIMNKKANENNHASERTTQTSSNSKIFERKCRPVVDWREHLFNLKYPNKKKKQSM